MEPTTGLILRKITQTELSVSAHKLATLILDGIAWKQGYNGLPRGTAAFTLAALAEKMGVSRQYLSVLLGELEASALRLERRKPYGKYAPWLFRFAAFDLSDRTGQSPRSPGVAITPQSPKNRELMDHIKAAPIANRQFHATDLCRAIGDVAYKARISDVVTRYGCERFTAMLAVHGLAVRAGEIAR